MLKRAKERITEKEIEAEENEDVAEGDGLSDGTSSESE